MTATLNDLGTLDYLYNGLPLVQGSTDAAVPVNSLDYLHNGQLFYGVESAPTGPNDTTLSGEISVTSSLDGSLTAQIALAGTVEVTSELTGYLNLGTPAKMEIVF